MKQGYRLWLAVAAQGFALASWIGVTLALIWVSLEPTEQFAMGQLLGSRIWLLCLSWLLAWALLAWGSLALYRHYVRAPARLLEETRVLISAPSAQQLKPRGSEPIRSLTLAVNDLAAQRDHLRADIKQQVAQASRSVQQEKNRLAALMSELTQSVVVCNLDGRILLYNQRARVQFRFFSQAPGLVDGSGLIGIGRSIYAVFDRQLVAHALENIHRRLVRGAASVSTQFVTTTPSGQLLRVQIAPVRPGETDASNVDAFSGFVLMLDNVTHNFQQETLRDQLLHGLTEGSRSSLANMQAALDMLGLPDLETPMRERFMGVIGEELAAMSARVTDLVQHSTQGLKTRWPLEEMLGSDLITAAQRHIEDACQRTVSLDEVDESLWLKVESFTLMQALTYLSTRLVDEFEVKFLRLRLQSAAGNRARLDLIWTGHAMSSETVMSWEMDPMRFGADSTPLTVRDVVERHGGEMWFERERIRHEAFFRFLLPLASAQEQLEATQFLQSDSRPEYYDFDLFAATTQTSALDEQRLTDLSYTVFDTETTGLNPSQGDAIIQLGAVRIVNNKLLLHECFEQLVNPARLIPATSTQIHGITQEMVAGKPHIEEVLPVFHAFARDTVLVAHNAAFDMKFLELQQAGTGVVFDQPVLDTLLLSAVLHPNQESHSLEELAERFNITALGRHTALGDAMVTAEVMLRLIALLNEKGIQTLRQAREAAQASYYARLKY
jgi:DNA polymerase-3 subunit epsilon